MYTKYTPCVHCAKYVLAAGITRVVVGKVYRLAPALDYLRSAGVEVEVYKPNPDWNAWLVQLFSHDIEDREAPEGNVKLQGKS